MVTISTEDGGIPERLAEDQSEESKIMSKDGTSTRAEETDFFCNLIFYTFFVFFPVRYDDYSYKSDPYYNHPYLPDAAERRWREKTFGTSHAFQLLPPFAAVASGGNPYSSLDNRLPRQPHATAAADFDASSLQGRRRAANRVSDSMIR